MHYESFAIQGHSAFARQYLYHFCMRGVVVWLYGVFNPYNKGTLQAVLGYGLYVHIWVGGRVRIYMMSIYFLSEDR